MKRHLLIAFSLVAVLLCTDVPSALAGGGRGGRGNSHGRPTARSGNFNRGFNAGFGFGGGYDCNDFAELYRELYNNLPYFALHPPVYYSEPVPRTYGYSPFAYPPGVMTPEISCAPQPVTINNPYVPSATPAAVPTAHPDRSADATTQVEPLVVLNPYVTQSGSVAQSE